MEEFKYALLMSRAYEETDNHMYVAMGTDGELMAVGDEMLELWRSQERLVGFDTVAQAMLDKAVDEVRILGGDRTFHEVYARRMAFKLSDAALMLGRPPKDQVDFHTLPQSIVDELNWKTET
jgi:hypothetical protein